VQVYGAIVDLAPVAAISLFQSYGLARRSWSLHAGPSLAHHSRRLDYGRSTTFTVSLEGISETEAAGILKFCTTIAIARTRQANRNSNKAIVLHVCHEQPVQELMILNAPPLPGDPRHHGQGYEE